MGHARLSPSGASRWMNCPGSVAATEGIPDKAGLAAIDGTHAHDLLEYCITNHLNPKSFIGQVFKEVMIDQDKAEAVQVAYNYAMETATNNFAEMYVEMKVTPDSLLRADIFGTADLVLVSDTQIEVIDYKHGRGVVVEVDNNRQMQIYAIGVLDTLNIEIGDRTVVTTIIQPRAFHAAGPIRSSHYNEAQVSRFTTDIVEAAAKTDRPDAERIAGKLQCKFCRAKATCSALTDQALKATGTNLSTATTESIQASALRDPGELTPEQITMVLENEDLIRGWLAAVHEFAVNTIQGGGDVQGFKLTAGRKSKSWTEDDAEVSDILRTIKKLDGGMLKLADVQVSKLKSPAAIEKMISAHVTKAALKKVRALYTVSEGKPQLTPAASNKPALATKAEDVFAPVPPSFM